MSVGAFEGFALLELMGHRQRVGRVSEVEAFGGKLLRIDVLPARDGQSEATEFYGCASIYGLTPVTEEVARSLARRYGAFPAPRPRSFAIEDHAVDGTEE
ncbi:hypothetical protein [Methylorubrum populi]|uniref:hypothetical protein n=1 Tax=Methylorubrum populi TaxID=223967 RepID=UPI000DB66773|nr:hypothetical protein [Methylorubrum populi]PZP65566.1 MAG: acetyltransferase [Methylorubrum populi]